MSKNISKIFIALAILVSAVVSLQAGDVSAYYSAVYKDAKTVKADLGKAGFKVLNTYSPA